MPRVRINKGRSVELQAGSTLLAGLAGQGIFLPTSCGGRGICRLCKVKITAGAGPASQQEQARLGDLANQGYRLACQVRVVCDLDIELPQRAVTEAVRAVLVGQQDLTQDIRLFRFELRDPTAIQFEPGQYIRLVCPPYRANPEPAIREYSVASNPADGHVIELIIRKVPNGVCTRYLFDILKIGQEVFLSRPLGDFRLREGHRPAVFVAGGSGLAPFMSMLYHLANTRSKRDITLIFGARTVGDLYLIDRIRQLQQEIAGLRFVPVVATVEAGQVWLGKIGLVTDAIVSSFSDLSDYEGYLCGPPAMIDAALKVMTGRGMSDKDIFYDTFS